MRKFTLLVFCSICILQSYGQDQLRFKVGVSRTFPTGNNSGLLHSTMGSNSYLPSQIGLEYYHLLPEKKAGFLAGAAFEVQRYGGGINYSKFQPTIGRFSLGSDYGSIKLYAGYEKILIKGKKPNSNTFSVFGGAGLGINVIGMGGRAIQGFEATTLNGDLYQGTYFREEDEAAGKDRSFVIRARRANTITPEVFGGMRWNIKNRQAQTVVTLEAVVNYSLLPKAYIEFPYTLNGVPKVDRIKNNGLNAQFNVLVPFKTFKINSNH